MTKKAEKTVSREYLNSKLNTFREQLEKVDNILDTYIEIRQKLLGAVEVTNSMLKDLGEEEVEPEVKKDE
jgi:hypothetical protein